MEYKVRKCCYFYQTNKVYFVAKLHQEQIVFYQYYRKRTPFHELSNKFYQPCSYNKISNQPNNQMLLCHLLD